MAKVHSGVIRGASEAQAAAGESDAVVMTPLRVAQASATLSGAEGGAATLHRLVKSVTGIPQTTATSVLTVTIPNGNHAAAVRLAIIVSNGAADAFESTRVVSEMVVFARTTGANAVATAVAVHDAGIATVSGGATLTYATAVSTVTGAVGATNTFEITVALTTSGATANNTAVVYAELINSEASGVTIA